MKLNYTYTPKQVRVFEESQTTLTPLDLTILNRVERVEEFIDTQDEERQHFQYIAKGELL